MKSLFTQTEREKIGNVDGINLFFGALLGANLGTTGTLAALPYAQLVALLVGLVITIRMVSVSERRAYAYATLAAYVMLFAVILTVPGLGIEGLAGADLNRLLLTLAIWIGATLLVELMPVRTPPPPLADDAEG
jgi:hypothetical protein